MSEQKRLLEHREKKKNWKKWGPFLSERAWGTVREDYGSGNPWEAFPFDEAHKRVFRWGEDGLGGISDRFQYLCFALALWNGKDPILKERLFGLGSGEGNHGEDVKELYYYLDATPTSSYLKMLYKYPQEAFPYEQLRKENRSRGLDEEEFELLDTGIFREDRYFDVLIEYAKEDVDDILCRITVTNRGPKAAMLTLLPTIWFRNTWKWGYENGPTGDDGGKPHLFQDGDTIRIEHPVLGNYHFSVETPCEFLFCENDTDVPYPKDSIGRYVTNGESVNPEKTGTKAAALYTFTLSSEEEKQIYCRIAKDKGIKKGAKIFEKKIAEADDFYETVQEEKLSAEMKNLQRQAFAGMLFSKQFYYLDQMQWMKGTKLDAKTLFSICQLPNVLGIKDATGDLNLAMELVGSIPLFSGDDVLALAQFSLGFTASITVVGNVIPKEWKAFVDLALEGNFLEARKAFFALYGLCQAMILETNPQCVKYGVSVLGHCLAKMRLPLLEPLEENKAKIKEKIPTVELALQ